MPQGMDVDPRAVLRGLAAVGTTIAFLAMFLPWYLFEVILPARGGTAVFSVPVTLWNVTTLAPILIAVGAVAALACLTLVTARWAGAVEALVGLGIVAYAIVRAFDVPDLGVAPAGAANAATRVGGGIFLAVAGGLMLLIGSLGDLLPAEREPGAAEEQPAPGRRFEREAAGAPEPASRPRP
jgi:hypothetical protein